MASDRSPRPRIDPAGLEPADRVRLAPYLDQSLVDNAVSLVTSAHRGRNNVMAVTFFAESSHVPPLVRISISPRTLTHELIGASGWFGLSLLAKGQEDLALECGILSGWDGSKFEKLHLPYETGPHGVPLLPACLTTSECKLVETITLQDYTLFVGEIVQSYRQTRNSFRDTLLISDLLDHLDRR